MTGEGTRAIPVHTIENLTNQFRAHGVSTIYVKHLSPKQDNEKNQIYLGSGLDGVTNIFPATKDVRSLSQSANKRKSKKGRPKLEACINLAWLVENGVLYPAPNTRIIDYFQFAEVRMAGFLLGCKLAPDALRRRFQRGFGKRILALGLAPTRQVIGRDSRLYPTITPGLSTPCGSSRFFASPITSPNSAGLCCSYHFWWSRPTA